MPIVLNYPAIQRYPDTRGYETGRAILDPIAQALMQGLMSGRIGRVPATPTPQNLGQLTFPSGATTSTNPLELAQLQALGGVPSRQGDVVPFGQPSTGGVQYTQPTRLGFRPDIDFQLRQAQLQQAQQELAKAPFEQRRIEAELARAPLERLKTEAEIAERQARSKTYTPEFQAEKQRFLYESLGIPLPLIGQPALGEIGNGSPIGTTGEVDQQELIGLFELAQDESDPELQELAIQQLIDLGELDAAE